VAAAYAEPVHILFLTHYYRPESNAPANRVSELARAWVDAGHRVTVVTGVPNHPGGKPYPGYRNAAYQTETIDGVEIIRLGTFMAPNEGILRRLLNYLSYLAAVALNVFRLPRADVVVSTSPQFFAGLSGALVATVQRRPWVLEIRDIWPESIAAVGAMKRGIGLRLVEAIETWAYRRADQVVVVSPAFVPHIDERYPLRRPVAVIENGVDLGLFAGADAAGGAVPTDLEGRVVFGYIGTHGMAHSLETVLRAAALTADDDRIGWLLVGSGAERDRLVAMKAALGLHNLVMLDHQPRSAMPGVWSSIDVSLVVLRRSDVFLRVIPSKIFEAMAMSRPIILGVDGEARRIVEAGNCGVFIPPEDPAALAAAARAMVEDPALRAKLGSAGANFVRANYDRNILADRYLAVISEVISASAPGLPNASD
jgi:glycosyltransferase involved in cell wall biosynthesis